MNIQKYKLVKLATDDDLCAVRDGVELGKEFLVDEDSLIWQKMYNVEFEVHHVKVIGDVYDDQLNPTGWLPIDLLEPIL